MKGLIFIKIFRISLSEYFNHLKNYKTANLLAILTMTISSVLSSILADDAILGFVFCLIIFPLYMQSLIKETPNQKLILTKNKNSEKNTFVKIKESLPDYLFKYLKFSIIILTIFTAIFFYSFISSLISWFFIIYKIQGLITFLFLILSLILVTRSFSLIFSLFFILIISEKDNLSIIKSIFVGRKKFKKYFLSHLLSVCAFAFISHPLIIIADLVINIEPLCYLLIGIYTICFINYAILDSKIISKI